MAAVDASVAWVKAGSNAGLQNNQSKNNYISKPVTLKEELQMSNRRDSGGGRKSGGSTVHQRIEELRLQREERRRSAEEYKVGSDTYPGKEETLSPVV